MVKLLKLVSGEEVLADVQDVADGLQLKTPIRLMASSSGFGFAPFLAGVADDKITVVVKLDHVMVQVDPDKELVNFYNEKFGSGLVLA